MLYSTLVPNSGSLPSRRVDHPLFYFVECFSLYLYYSFIVCFCLFSDQSFHSLLSLYGCIEREFKESAAFIIYIYTYSTVPSRESRTCFRHDGQSLVHYSRAGRFTPDGRCLYGVTLINQIFFFAIIYLSLDLTGTFRQDQQPKKNQDIKKVCDNYLSRAYLKKIVDNVVVDLQHQQAHPLSTAVIIVTHRHLFG